MKRCLAGTPALAVLVLAVLATGCAAEVSGLSATTASAAGRCGPPVAVELIIGAHRNAPRPALGPVALCRVTTAISAGKHVQMVISAGQPQIVPLHLNRVTGGTLAQQASPRVTGDVQLVRRQVIAARPASPGVDDLAALSVAADQARSAGDSHAALIVMDSGLDDRGALDFAVPGLVAATPTEVVSQLKADGDMPDLRGFTVVLIGIGYTASPQPPLSAKWRSNVTAIWVAVVSAAGATADVVPEPGQGPSISTPLPVRSVPVPSTMPVRVADGTTIVFTGASAVRFEPNTTAFTDPAAATTALTPVARWLTADPSRHAFLEGTTADVGTLTGQQALARLRAGKVAQILMKLGVSVKQLTVTGAGSRFRQFVPDRNAAGVLLAGPATLNRSVRIRLSSVG